MDSRYHLFTTCLVVLLGACLLNLPHFHNGFPFLLGDSQGYIIRAMSSIESNHWSNTYTVLVRWCIAWFKTIQVIPFLQNLLIAYLLYLFVHNVFKKRQFLIFFGILIGLLFTTLPWTSVMLMSDIFTPAALLIIYLFINFKLQWVHLIPLGIVFFFASSCHQSNLVILPLFLMVVSIGNILYIKNKSKLNVLSIGVSLMALLAFSFLFEKKSIQSSSVASKKQTIVKESPKQKQLRKKQAAKTKKVKKWKRKNKSLQTSINQTSGASGYYFVIVRMWEVGELDNLLDSYCENDPGNYMCDPNNPYEIKVHLPMIHDRNDRNKNYILYASDNKLFVHGILLKPRFYYACLKALFKRSPILLQQTQIRDFVPIKNGGIKNSLNTKPFNDSRAYGLSKQFNGYYSSVLVKNYTLVDRFWWWLIIPFVLLLVVGISIKRKSLGWISKERWLMLSMLCLAHLTNIVICGTFSNHLNSRYSMRTLWLVNLAVILIVIFIFQRRKDSQVSSNEENTVDIV